MMHNKDHLTFNRSLLISIISVIISVFILFVSIAGADYPPPSEDEDGYYINHHHKPPSPLDSHKFGFNSIANFNHDPNKPASRDYGLQGQWSNLNPQIYGFNGLPALYATGKCVNIPRRMTLCKDVGYKKMLIPNFLDHYTVGEAVHQSSSWVGVRAASCHKDISPFLCSLYAPLCIEGQGLRPCRSMCKAVQEACEPSLKRFNYSWPEMFRCDQFPDEDQLCLRTQVDKLCQACKPTTSFEQALDLFCQADFVVKVSAEESVATEHYLRVAVNKKMKIVKFKPKNRWTRRQHLFNETFYVKGGYNCDCPQLETIDGVRDNSSLIFMGKFDRDEEESPIEKIHDTPREDIFEDNLIQRDEALEDKLYASSVIVLTKNLRRILQKVHEVGKDGIEDFCRNGSKIDRRDSSKVNRKGRKKKNKESRRLKPNKSDRNSKQKPERLRQRTNDKKRKRGGVTYK